MMFCLPWWNGTARSCYESRVKSDASVVIALGVSPTVTRSGCNRDRFVAESFSCMFVVHGVDVPIIAVGSAYVNAIAARSFEVDVVTARVVVVAVVPKRDTTRASVGDQEGGVCMKQGEMRGIRQKKLICHVERLIPWGDSDKGQVVH